MWKFSLVVFLPHLFVYKVYTQQFSFNFENRELSGWHQSHQGHWHLDTIHPLCGSASLHHNYDNQEAGFDAISYNHDMLYLDKQDASWEFVIQHRYNPSSSNNWAVWLVADNGAGNMGPEGTNSGYIIGVNFIGSDDYLKLWRKEDNQINGVLSTDFNWQEGIDKDTPVWIKVERTVGGIWKIFYDLTGKKDWQYLDSKMDGMIKSGNCFGVYYQYSSSQDKKLWIDDIFIKGFFSEDTVPPKPENYSLIGPSTIDIKFSEPVDTANPEYICRLNKKDFPVEHLWISNKELQLVFDVEFPEKNSLELFSFTDLAGNVSSYQCIDFVYYVARKFDIVISEIMADPTPSAGLPECEYLELANQCGQDIEIRNWSLLIGGDTIKFPGYTIHSGEYLLLCGADHVDGFSDSVHILGLSGFPALSNEGALIQLYNDKMELIHAVHFSREWYSSTAKQEGGWSLEIKDISHACIIDDNWSESISNRGGTPGKANSVAGSVADTAAPFVKQVFLNEEMQLEIVFSESMDRASLVDIENYSDEIIQFFDPPCVSKPFAEKVVLTFKNQLNDYQKHVLKLSSMLTDCSGNSIKDKFVFYGLPQEADSSDIIINEVMFESTEDIPEFIEIYNNSQKIIDLRNFQLGYFDSFTETFTRQILFTRDNFYIYPGDYLTITPDKGQLCNYYQINDQRKVIGAGKWINLVNDGGKIAVISSTGKIIDQSSYNKEMHFGLLVETSGVSLEKIACNVSGTDGDNWHSASSLSNYASPCRQNSQHYFSNSGGSSFVLEPEGISPDNDGYRDFLSISYRFNKPGYLISIAVYNTKGEEVAIIANNELSGTEGIYYWKGLDANNDKLPMGYYIVFCEAIHPEGEKKQKKGSVLVLPQKK